ncbi:MAG: hypothetical protein GX660_28060 [Clostridiaceae bacterium]|nr:hypothetical protein [Clostridiaceae bacterium]
MKLKLFFRSLFYFRNIGVLAVASVLLFSIYDILPELIKGVPGILMLYAGVVTVYFGAVLQSMQSKKFQDNFLHKEKQKRIIKLDRMCNELASETKKHTNKAYYKKLCDVMEDKKEIINQFNKEEPDFLKEKTAEQALNLVLSYIKLLRNFCIRSRELGLQDVSPVMERITQNYRKLNFANDPKVYEDIKKIIEMDERIITRLKSEKLDLDRIDAKLDYIKSTVGMLKHQISSRLGSEEMLGQIESILNEAVALENVLEERHKKKQRN